MKLKTLVIFALLPVIAHLWLKGLRRESEFAATEAVSTDQTESALASPAIDAGRPVTPVSSAASQAAPHPLLVVDAATLTQVRGEVIVSPPSGVIVDCDVRAPDSAAGFNVRLPVTSGRDDIKRMASLAVEQAEKNFFGSMNEVQDGRLRESGTKPRRLASGRILLMGYNARAGTIVNLIAAPLRQQNGGTPVYAAQFKLKSGGWMWQP